ncbi:hypothetical protein B5X24_HaOG207782 [Helicoverpa armigera]|nr:hypothetical protein B5X24_HaOG207782 [Helicoverpa armigera]
MTTISWNDEWNDFNIGQHEEHAGRSTSKKAISDFKPISMKSNYKHNVSKNIFNTTHNDEVLEFRNAYNILCSSFSERC